MNLGVQVAVGEVTFGDTTAKQLFALPKGAYVLDVRVQVETAFNDSGTDLLDIGTDSDADYFVNDADVSSAGYLAVTLLQAPKLTSLTGITATYTGQNSNASAGKALVYVVFGSPFEPR